MAKKKFGGKRKIQIKKIENKKNLLVSFSKRRAGLFKKAVEYSKISGARVAVLVQSPGGRFYSFVDPASASASSSASATLDSILDQFLASIMPSSLSSCSSDAASADDQAKNKYAETMKNFIEEVETNHGCNGKQPVLEQPSEDNLEWVDEVEKYMVAMEGLESNDVFQEDEAMNRSADHTTNLEYFDGLPMNNYMYQGEDWMNKAAENINGIVDSSILLSPNCNLDWFGGFNEQLPF